MPNALTRSAGLQLGPVALDILFKHYFDRVKKEKAGEDHPFTQLRQDELLYDEVFNIAKRFFVVSSNHTVEELQSFSNARTISPPSVRVTRVIVPMSCCDEAAELLIKTLGGVDHVSLLLGGTRWWQARGITGVPGEWMTAKKDWEESKRRRKSPKKSKDNSGESSQATVDPLPSSNSEPENVYDKSADDLRCILYIHGGGYYFGSIDQERYCMQRLARKIKGRVFAVNYRLAPQYPFPCALQDLIAAYLYLVNPPPGAPHQPVKPSHIVVAGGSAGGGLALALLQVLRDSGQPPPVGGVLISPWCDLTHSFPSIHTNTATDVLPSWGLCLHKPSTLWPPPSEKMTREIHTGIRQKIRQFVRATIPGKKPSEVTTPEPTEGALASLKNSPTSDDGASPTNDIPVDVGVSASFHEKKDQTVILESKSGEQLSIDSQIQLYTENTLLEHPLVTPALSYLGGLPPLLFIASDKEVLRDEIIYSAHKAAFPSMFPLKDEVLALYPPLIGIAERYGPTQVHLQVYDDTAHVLPVLFPFTTPAKFCYRAMATFVKHITGILDSEGPTPSSSEEIGSAPPASANEAQPSDASPRPLSPILSSDIVVGSPRPVASPDGFGTVTPTSSSSNIRPSSSRSVFFRTKSIREPMSRSISEQSFRPGESSQEGRIVRSARKLRRSKSMIDPTVRYAGEPSIYYNKEGLPTWKGSMIRERVSTQGVIRPLEPMDKLDALHVPLAIIGVLSERAVRRYLQGKTVLDQKFSKEHLAVEKQRNRNIDLAKKDSARSFTQFQELYNGRETYQAFKDGLESPTGAWAWACADERPPPSSIVSRRDTNESRRLARIACRSFLQDESHWNSNNLWNVIVNILTPSPTEKHAASDTEVAERGVERTVVKKKSRSVFASLRIRERPRKD